jgi:F0F1-type ATP synthase assembly protein I
MADGKRRYRTIYLVTAALMVAMIGGYVLAATTLTTLSPGQTTNVTTTPNPTGFTGAAITSEELVVLTAAMTGSHVAGVAGTVAGLNGTTLYALPSCTAAPCAVQNARPASATAETVGDYGEQIVMTVTQLTTGSVPFDFSLSIAISFTVGGAITLVPAVGFLATGASGTGATVTFPLYLFVDLGTTNAPIINSISVVFNQCSSTSYCP